MSAIIGSLLEYAADALFLAGTALSAASVHLLAREADHA